MASPTDDFDAWRERLLTLGRFPPVSEPTYSYEQAEANDEEYLELIDAIDPETAGNAVLEALLDSIQVDTDDGLYLTTLGSVLRFPPRLVGPAAFRAVQRLRMNRLMHAYDLIEAVSDVPDIAWAFNDAWAAANQQGEDTCDLAAWVREEEDGGVLDGHRRGVLAPWDGPT